MEKDLGVSSYLARCLQGQGKEGALGTGLGSDWNLSLLVPPWRPFSEGSMTGYRHAGEGEQRLVLRLQWLQVLPLVALKTPYDPWSSQLLRWVVPILQVRKLRPREVAQRDSKWGRRHC